MHVSILFFGRGKLEFAKLIYFTLHLLLVLYDRQALFLLLFVGLLLRLSVLSDELGEQLFVSGFIFRFLHLSE